MSSNVLKFLLTQGNNPNLKQSFSTTQSSLKAVTFKAVVYHYAKQSFSSRFFKTIKSSRLPLRKAVV